MVDPVCSELATKAELQELRDQLNSWLGQKEDGGSEKIFIAGAGGLITAGLVADTALQATKDRAKEAITDIVIDSADDAPIWKQLKEGTAKLLGFKGNGTKKPLNGLTKVTKAVGDSAGAAAAAAPVITQTAAATLLLANLVNIAATIGLNIATVKVLDARIDAEAEGTQIQLDAINNSMLRLYNKNQGDVAAANQEIEEQRLAIEAANNVIDANSAGIQQARDTNSQLTSDLDDAQQKIVALQSDLASTRDLVNANASDFNEVIGDLTGSINTVETELGQAINIINTQKKELEATYSRLDALENSTKKLKERMQRLDLQYILLREQFIKLDEDLNKDINDTNDKVSDLEGKLLITQKWVKQNRNSGGSGVAGAKGSAGAQTGILDLTAKLGNTTNDTTIYSDDIYNQSTKFKDKFASLLEGVSTGSVDQQQLDDLRTNLGSDFSALLGVGLLDTIKPDLTDIKNQTNLNSISNAVQDGLCKNLNTPNSCGTGANGTPNQGLKGLGDALKGKQDAILTALQAADLAQGAKILGVVQDTNKAVKSAEHGLEVIQNFAAKAWEATGADKVVSVIGTVTSLHNAAMLSQNVGQSLGDTVSAGLSLFNITAPGGGAIDVNAAIGGFVESKLEAIFSETVLNTASAAWLKINRIHQAVGASVSAIQGTKNALLEADEITGGNVARIGNALMEQGVIEDNTYDYMNDEPDYQTPFKGVLGKIQAVEEIGDRISSVVSTGLEIKETSTELVTTSDELAKAIDDFRTAKTEQVASQTEESKSPEIDRLDLLKSEAEE